MNSHEAEQLAKIIAELRHAYQNLMLDMVSTNKQHEFAENLLAPQIVRLEKLITDNPPKPKYKLGDFVMYYEGLGESGHGKIVTIVTGGYKIESYFAGKSEGYVRHVTKGDMRGVCTIEDSLEYERIRGAGYSQE